MEGHKPPRPPARPRPKAERWWRLGRKGSKWVAATIGSGIIGTLVAIPITNAVSGGSSSSPEPPPHRVARGPSTDVICVDTSASTLRVRAQYLNGVMAVAERAASRRALLFISPCGGNPAGTVTWPVTEDFRHVSSNGNDLLRKRELASRVAALRPAVERAIKVTEPGGSPLGATLQVMARRCGDAGSACRLWFFTDGLWSDEYVDARRGISARERNQYIRRYAPSLRSIRGSTVLYIGVGLGTDIAENHLADARRLATELPKAAKVARITFGDPVVPPPG